MEVAQKQKVWHNVEITGRWLLTYEIKNNQGPMAFGGKHLSPYPNPYTQQKTWRKSVNGTALNGLMMDRLSKIYLPDEYPQDKLDVNWLIMHPEVKVEGVKDLDPKIVSAKTGMQITLKCLDYVVMQDIEDEDFIDRVIGRLTLDGGTQAIGLEKLRYVLAALGQSYYDNRYEGAAEKKMLRSKLKTWTRKSIENARLVQEAIDSMDESQDNYYFKEMLRFKVLVPSNGVYKFQNTPIGANESAVNAFFSNHPDTKAAAMEALMKLLK